MSMEINCDDAGRRQLEGDNAVFFSDCPSDGLFTLRRGKSLSVESLPVVTGAFSETLALKGTRRVHQAAEADELSFESESVIPFGVKTVIGHNYRMTPRQLCGAIEFKLPHAFGMTKISAGGIAISGRIKEFGFTPLPETSGVQNRPALADFNTAADNTVIYKSQTPLLFLCVKADDGSTVEFQTGDSVWRWINASRLEGHAEYTLSRKDGKLVYQWDLFTWDKPAKTPEMTEEPQPPFGRPWRIDWVIRWNDGSPETEFKRSQCKDVFDCAKFDWPVSAVEIAADGSPVKGQVCFAAPVVRNILKKWLRTRLASVEEGDIFGLANVQNRICFSSSHMQRAKVKTLIHWDEPALDDILRWANRQLASKGASLVIVKD